MHYIPIDLYTYPYLWHWLIQISLSLIIFNCIRFILISSASRKKTVTTIDNIYLKRPLILQTPFALLCHLWSFILQQVQEGSAPPASFYFLFSFGF